MNQKFLAYWLGYDTGRSLESTPEQVDIVALAFGVNQPNNTITTDFLCSKHTKEEILKGARVLQARGVKVIMSLNGNPNPKSDPQDWHVDDPVTFARNVKSIVIDEWGLDGVDLDNEGNNRPEPSASGNFVQVIKALRQELGQDKIISLPVYLGTFRDAYLTYVKDDIDFVFTMAYWNGYDGQIDLLKEYQSLVGDSKAGIGVANAANPGQNTPFDIVPDLARYNPKAGMMLWTLNSNQAPLWSQAIGDNIKKN